MNSKPFSCPCSSCDEARAWLAEGEALGKARGYRLEYPQTEDEIAYEEGTLG